MNRAQRRAQRVKGVQCGQCGAVASLTDLEGWNAEFKAGRAVAIICPACQTPEQDLEAAVNEAMLDYSSRDGLIVGTPKGADQ